MNALKDVIINLIGEYEPITIDYDYVNSLGDTVHAVAIEKDWAWIWSCIVFIVVVYCVFRVIGAILKG